MKSGQQHIHQGSQPHQKINLKEMLNYYKQNQTPALDRDLFDSTQYHDVEMLNQEVKLPETKYQHFACLPHHNSEQLRFRSLGTVQQLQNLFSLQLTDESMGIKGQSSSKLTRERISVMNKKSRNIRTSHYRANSQKNQDYATGLDAKQPKQIDKIIVTKIQRAHSGVLIRNTSESHARSVHRIQRNMSSKVSVDCRNQPEEARSVKVSRCSISNKEDVDRIVDLKKNPLVVYPFQSKLKVKRIDDNPRILSNTIIKKSKNMSKKQLYDFINCLISRRDKNLLIK